MIAFYTLAISNYCARVEIALRLKDLAFTARPPPDGYGSKAYKNIVPTGTIPAIVDADLTLSESDAIVEYLEDAYPKPRLLPDDITQRARCRQLSRLHDTRFEPSLRTMFVQIDPTARDQVLFEDQINLFETRLADIAALCQPSPYLAGQSPGMPDCALAPTLLLAEKMLAVLTVPPIGHGSLAGWRELVSRHPAFEPVLAAHALAIDAWLRAKGAID